MRLPASLRTLRHPGYATVTAAGMVSNVGSWMATVAVGSLVRSSTGSDTWVAITSAAAFLPIGLLSPVGGALADKVPRRPFIAAMAVVQFVLLGLLTALSATGRATPAVVTMVMAASGCVTAVQIPFNQAILPDLVPRDEIVAAVSLGQAQYNLGRVLGPALAGLAITLFGFPAAFGIDALSYLAVGAAMLAVKLPPPPETTETGLFRRIATGAQVMWTTPPCRAAVLHVAVLALTVSPFIALIAGRVAPLTDGTAAGIARGSAVLTTAQGVGAVLGALVYPSLGDRFGRRTMLLAGLVAAPVMVVAYAWAPNLALAAVGLAGLGAAYMAVLSGLGAVVQLRAPEAFRGRVLSIYMVALGVLYPVGALWQGRLGDQTSLAAATTIGASLFLLWLLLLKLFKPTMLAALDSTEDQITEDPDTQDPSATPSPA